MKEVTEQHAKMTQQEIQDMKDKFQKTINEVS